MLNFRDLSDNGYLLFDKGRDLDLNGIIKSFRHIKSITIKKGLQYVDYMHVFPTKT